MTAESLIRILNKRRDRALSLGVFFVPLLGRAAASVQEDKHLAVHDAVLAPLLAKAVECRVYGVSRQSRLWGLLSLIGTRAGRVWHLEPTRELVRGYEPIWNSVCEHNGIVIVSRPALSESQTILDNCGCPDAWGSRYQLYQGTSRAAVSHCFEVARSGEQFAFLIPGSNGLEWMDVFANEKYLPISGTRQCANAYPLQRGRK